MASDECRSYQTGMLLMCDRSDHSISRYTGLKVINRHCSHISSDLKFIQSVFLPIVLLTHACSVVAWANTSGYCGLLGGDAAAISARAHPDSTHARIINNDQSFEPAVYATVIRESDAACSDLVTVTTLPVNTISDMTDISACRTLYCEERDT